MIAVADVAMPFLSILHRSGAAFLLASLTFAPHLTTSRHLSQSCAKYFKQLGVIPIDFMGSFEALFQASLGAFVLSVCSP